LRILAVGALIEPLIAICGMVMITQGRTKYLFWFVVMYGFSLILGFSIGVQWGAIGVAAGYTIAHYVMIVPSLWLSFKDTPVSITLFLKALSKPIFFGVIVAVLLLILANGTVSWPSGWRVGLSLVIAAISYLGLWMIHPRGRERLFDNVSSLLSAFFKPAPSVSR